MVTTLRNVVVVGGSYVGISAAQQLASVLPVTHRVLLVEPHSHFHHLFAFPRFAIVAGHEHKAFIPYTGIWKDVPDPSIHAVVRAKVLDVQPNRVVLDRQWEGSTEIPFDFVTFATGTRLTAPGTMESDDKAPSIAYFQDYQAKVAAAKSIVIIGGGAVGVQMATDLRELHPDKKVTLVQSRDRLMPRFHSQFHDIIAERFSELGVDLVLNNRVVIPDGGFPEDGRTFNVQLKDGSEIETQLVIRATGQTPNNQLLAKLPASSPDSIINPDNGFIRVKPTMQFLDPQYPNMFAVGDIADTGAHKAARPGAGQAAVVAKNIAAIIAGLQPTDKIEINPAGIHMTLGMVKNIVFRNPGQEDGAEPSYFWRDDGKKDMGINGVWGRRGVTVTREDDYKL